MPKVDNTSPWHRQLELTNSQQKMECLRSAANIHSVEQAQTAWHHPSKNSRLHQDIRNMFDWKRYSSLLEPLKMVVIDTRMLRQFFGLYHHSWCAPNCIACTAHVKLLQYHRNKCRQNKVSRMFHQACRRTFQLYKHHTHQSLHHIDRRYSWYTAKLLLDCEY